MHPIVWVILLGLSSVAGAQDVFQGRSGTATLPPDLYNGAEPAPDLHKYLSADGHFDRCRYWHDHPDSTTLMYGQPDSFPPGQIGDTRSFNGQPPPYLRCAVDPCPPNGAICWRNPAKPTTLSAQLKAMLKAQGCEAEPNGEIYCQKDRMPHPGPPSPTLSSGLVKSVCRVIGTGISCDPGSTPEPNRGIHSPPGPPPPPRYAPLDWSRVPACPDATSQSGSGGPFVNYFSAWDPFHTDADMSELSDPHYITVGGHGAPGKPGIGSCILDPKLVSPRQIAQDVHRLLSIPQNAGKGVRLAACYSAEAKAGDPNSVPLAQRVADTYRELYGVPISVEGYSGVVQYGRKSHLQDFPCRVFTSRTPLPEK
jgi:hypothetical protein